MAQHDVPDRALTISGSVTLDAGKLAERIAALVIVELRRMAQAEGSDPETEPFDRTGPYVPGLDTHAPPRWSEGEPK